MDTENILRCRVLIDYLIIENDLIKYILPKGVPRNTFMIISGAGGSGKTVLVNSIASSILAVNEPVVYVDFDDDPLTTIEQFKSFNVDIDKYVKNNLFYIIDGYTYLFKKERRRLHESVVAEVDPKDIDNTIYTILKILDEKNIVKKGVVIIDSLNEFLNYHDPSRVLELVKILRANVSKLRSVVTIATLHTSTNYYAEFLNSIEHLVDGILTTEVIVQHPLMGELPIPLRQVLVKKMKNTPHRISWTMYTIDSEGIKIVRIKT